MSHDPVIQPRVAADPRPRQDADRGRDRSSVLGDGPGDGPGDAAPVASPAGSPADSSVPLHPHPLSNDLTDEALPPRSPIEEEIESEGIGAAPRHVGKVVGGVVVFFVAIALIGTAVMFGERWELILLGGGIFILYVIFIGAPILLAAGTKAAQDEAVRDDRTPASADHRTDRQRTERSAPPADQRPSQPRRTGPPWE